MRCDLGLNCSHGTGLGRVSQALLFGDVADVNRGPPRKWNDIHPNGPISCWALQRLTQPFWGSVANRLHSQARLRGDLLHG